MKKIIKVLFVAVVVAVVATALFIAFRQFREGDRRTSALHAVTPEMIQEIEVYSDHNGGHRIELPEANSATSKALIAEAMHDLVGYSPNHDNHTQEFFIRMFVTSGEKHEFSIWLKPGFKDTAFMYMEQRSTLGGVILTKNLGGRKSSALYRWLEYHTLIK